MNVNKFSEHFSLTSRQQEVLEALIKTGDSTEEIAIVLGVSKNTVHNHFKTIFAKTKARSKAMLLSMYINHN